VVLGAQGAAEDDVAGVGAADFDVDRFLRVVADSLGVVSVVVPAGYGAIDVDLEPRLVKGAFTESGGAAAMQEVLDSGDLPTAVFAPNDFAALGAMEVIDQAGLSIPGDISLVGYDDLTIAALPRIALTTIGQPRADLGAQAVRLLLERLEEDRAVARHVVIPPHLVIRETTGPINPATP
jgi:DNA-binding LacI/PurR family transcriptional regulator